ncbi:hypothetical protein HDU98_012336 [Podochytrium sp. JEL0797]|nr:hypothetical protein HDU98_012336 [Podochytrium sp. JEL0797]
MSSPSLASLLAQLQQTSATPPVNTSTAADSSLSSLLGSLASTTQPSPAVHPVNVSAALNIPLSQDLIATLREKMRGGMDQTSQPDSAIPSLKSLPSAFATENKPSSRQSTPPTFTSFAPPPPPPRPRSFTSAILRELADLAETPRVASIVRTLKFAQSAKENMLVDQRKRILESHEKDKKQAYADEIMGKSSPESVAKQESQFKRDLFEFDKFVHKEMMDLMKKQQKELEMVRNIVASRQRTF